MKRTWIKSVSAALGLMAGAVSSFAGEVVINNFDDETEVKWAWENWSDPASVSFDSTLDAGGGGETSGSMRVQNNFPNRPDGYSQSVVTLDLHSNVDAETLYTKVSLDVRVDPASALRSTGTSYGALEVIFRNGPDWVWNSLGAVQLTSTNWVHLEFPVKAPGDKVHHLTLKLGENNLTNTVIYNVDNIRWTESAVEIPPPTLAIETAKPGLNLTAGSPGQYDRQNIKTVAPGLGWVGSGEPVSYSVTVKEFPSAANYAAFQTHLYLVPGTPGTESSPDWNEPTVIYIAIQAEASGAGVATFRYKTNAPNSNGPGGNGYFNTDPTKGFVGQLGTVRGASIAGTWTFTFANDTQVTLTAPDGTTTVVNLPAEDAALFSGDVTVYYGVMPNENANIGQTAILSGAKIYTPSNTLVEDNFETWPLDPGVWKVNATLDPAVIAVPAGESVWVSWTTPASGFSLESNPGFGELDWVSVTAKDALIGTRKRVLVTEDLLPSPAAGFFRLVKQQ